MDTNTWTTFAVFRSVGWAADGNTRTLLNSSYTAGAGGGSATLWFLMLHSNSNLYSVTRTAASGWIAPSFLPPNRNQWFLLTTVWNGQPVTVNGNAPTTTVARLQDESRTSYTPSTAVGGNATPSGHIATWIGKYDYTAGGNNELAFDGQIAEMLFYNTALSSNDVNEVELYLTRKYLAPVRGSGFVIR
jgi:hypothetical protein